jgi:hypothetical protein
LKTVLEGEVSGKNYRGRRRMEYVGQIMDAKTKSNVGMKRLAENREDWRAKPILGLMTINDDDEA